MIEGLKTGEKYTLHETVAPNDYNIASDTTFTIDKYGKVTTTGHMTDEPGRGISLKRLVMSGIAPVCGTSLRLKSCPPSDLARRIAVHLLEHAAEQLIVGESVSAQDLHDRIIR